MLPAARARLVDGDRFSEKREPKRRGGARTNLGCFAEGLGGEKRNSSAYRRIKSSLLEEEEKGEGSGVGSEVGSRIVC